ncbi:MAG: DUF465 domain-containing protein [Alphaproteobacteria bacterium]|jgi:hypothetical protein|nr:DUF465 domain-containing protein [Alphaproteobacteria bacterium]
MGLKVTTEKTANKEQLLQRLKTLKSEHLDLDDTITRITQDPTFDQLHLQRLKKRKLVLRDSISHLENLLFPNIIA